MKKLKFLFLPICFWSAAQEIDSVKVQETPKDLPKVQTYSLKDGSVRSYSQPKLFDFITKLPKDFVSSGKNFVEKDHAYYLGGAVASTLILLPLDQTIIDHSRRSGERWGMTEANRYSVVAGFCKIPKDVGAGIYLIGNGSTLLLLGIGFGTYGLIKNDYRAQATASGLMESLILTGVLTQTLKRITGRESPFIAYENGHNGGAWNPFPSFSAYAKNTPNYDAMPSGHLTTFMAGLTVIADNYPDKIWIKPVGYTFAAALCFQMMQSKVHWASDYPLALVMGYFIGKSISKSRYTVLNPSSSGTKYKLNLIASHQSDFNLVGVKASF